MRNRDPHPARPRPALHFAAPANWMNDPNGLIHWNGRIHLFYQHNPGGRVLEHMAWGHASSTDLWNWTDHPVALAPSPSGPDRDGCWSGCALVHDGTPHVLYTGLRRQRTLPCLASAADPGLISWSPAAHNPVIADWPPEPGVLAFRDHAAWHDGAAWYQVIGGGLAGRGGALFLYRSPDLRSWQYQGIFAAAADHGLPGQIWECPDVFALGRTSVVIVSACDDGPPHPVWMTGQISDGRFTPGASGRCDGGDRYYAPQSLPVPGGRRIAIGWLRESLDELTGQDRTRVGAMSLPRETYLQGANVRFRPARELDRARGQKLADVIIDGQGELDVGLSARARSAAELRVAPVRGAAGAIELRLRGAGCDDVEIRARPGDISVHEGERRLAGNVGGPGPATVPVLADGPVTLYYDQGILEVYGAAAPPAAVVCNRDGRYDRLGVSLRPLSGADPDSGAVRITGWSSGRRPG
jgi:beta-fructofuranosidase